MTVVVRDNDLDGALNRFMSELIRNGIIERVKDRTYHVSKSEKKAALRREYKKRKKKHNRAVRKGRI